MTFTELSLDELGNPVALLMSAFFTASKTSQAAGQAYIERLKLRVADRDAPVSMKAACAQLDAIREWAPSLRQTVTRCCLGFTSEP